MPRNPLEKANSIIFQAFPNHNFFFSGRNSAKIGPNTSHNNKNHCVIYFLMSSFDKISLNLREPEDALVWLDALVAKSWAEKKTDVAATDSRTTDFQTTDQFLLRRASRSSNDVPKVLKAIPTSWSSSIHKQPIGKQVVCLCLILVAAYI